MDFNFVKFEGGPNPRAPRAPGLGCGALFELDFGGPGTEMDLFVTGTS